MKRFHLLASLFFALNLSVWLGRAEQHTDDTGVLIGLIGLGGILLGIVEPQRPWMWGLIVPAGVIGVNVWSQFNGSLNPHSGGVAGLFDIAALTIAVATACSYAGALIRQHQPASDLA